MATQHGVADISRIAAEALTSNQFHLVKLNSAGKIVAVSATTDQPYGVLQDEPADTKPGAVKRYGASKVVAGAVIAAGARVYATAAGRVTSTPVLGSYPVGKALQEATADGAIIEVELDLQGSPVPAVVFNFPVTLSLADNGNVAKFVPGFAGRLVSMEATVTTITSDSSGKQAILNPDIAGTNVTGGVLTIDTDVVAADPDTLGKRIAATAITALNTFGATDEITIEAANTTPFTVGAACVTVVALMA